MEGEEQFDGAGTGFVGGFGMWDFFNMVVQPSRYKIVCLPDWRLVLLKVHSSVYSAAAAATSPRSDGSN